MLTLEHCKNCVTATLEFLEYFAQKGEGFLDSIMTGDETSVSHYTPESQEAEEIVKKWLKELAVETYDTGIQKLVPRLQKCFNLNGNYV